MNAPIPLNLAVEDSLTESLFTKILNTIPTRYATRTIYNSGGYGYLRRNINGFNHAAKGVPFLIGTDLDTYECPAALIQDWILGQRHVNLIIRVAVRESETWVLADRKNLAHFLGVREALIPDNVEGFANPKQELIRLAGHARSKDLRDDLCPPPNSTRRVGPNYNARLSIFVQQHWDPNAASQRSESLARAINRLKAFRPTWPVPLQVR